LINEDGTIGPELQHAVDTAPDPVQFPKIKSNERLFQRVVDVIEARLIAGELKPGDILPAERLLAEQFGVSRTVIREAIKILELQGVIEVQHGRGAVVVKPSADSVASSVVRFLRIQSSPLWALLELRTILEVEIAALAAERATPDDLKHLDEMLARMSGLVDRPSEYVELDMEFHRGLWRAAHNQLFPLVLEPFITLSRESRRLGANVPNAPRRSIEVHRRVLAAVHARDQESAREIMREHFEQVAEFLTAAGAQQGDTHGK
jgi:GntR family transcriptional repressor for pyruvate dehydrogenase complex